MGRYEAIIFDNDGVLTQPTTSSVIRAAVEATFRDFAVDPSEAAVEDAVDGTLARVRRACDAHGIDYEEFWSRREANAADAQREALLAGEKGLYDDVSALDELDVPLGLVSNNQHQTVEYVLDCFDLGDRFSAVYGREPDVRGIRRRKPAPYYLNRAIADLGVDEALYVGDSNVDLLAAGRAGVDAAFVRRPHRADYDLAAEPTHELDSLYDLPSLVDGPLPERV